MASKIFTRFPLKAAAWQAGTLDLRVRPLLATFTWDGETSPAIDDVADLSAHFPTDPGATVKDLTGVTATVDDVNNRIDFEADPAQWELTLSESLGGFVYYDFADGVPLVFSERLITGTGTINHAPDPIARTTFVQEVQGPSGTDGATWHTGSGAPGAGLGVDGDLYLDTATSDVYTKAAGSWGTAIANIQGAPGAQGDPGDEGPQGPEGPAGADGATLPPDVIDVPDATRNLQAGDVGNVIRATNSGGGFELTLPSDATLSVAIGQSVAVLDRASGDVTVVAGAGATVTPPPGFDAQSIPGALILATKEAANTWALNGALVETP